MLLLLSVALLVFGIFAAVVSYRIYLNSSIEQHKELAQGEANLVASSIDPDKVDSFLKYGYDLPDYIETKIKLYEILNSAPDIKYIYVYRILEDGCHVVFDLDTPEVIGNEPGSIEDFAETFIPYIPTLLEGKAIEPVISDDSYGWLLTVYVPVKNSEGVTQCYAAVDVSMDNLRDRSQNFLFKLAGIFFLVGVIILTIGFELVNRNIILPINKMTLSAENFAFNSGENFEKNLEQIKNLKIQTGDEIEQLYLAFLKMTGDSVKFLDDAEKKNKTISKMQNALIMTLADLVESRDENTGQHIRKTAAYVKIILKERKNFSPRRNFE